jgi:hypothetical protein
VTLQIGEEWETHNFFGAYPLYDFDVSYIVDRRMSTGLLLVGPVTTLIVTPMSNYDPISLSKMLSLSTFAFFVAGLMWWNRKEIAGRIPKSVLILSTLFTVWMFAVLLLSGAPIDQQFWGTFGRNTGLLSYLSLTLILLGTIAINNIESFKGIIRALVFTAIPMTIYCIVQVSGNDPVSWSSFAPFGTLGNINFLSAFLGITSLVCVILLFSDEVKTYQKLCLIVLVIIDIPIIVSTGSIQGFMIFIAGIGIAGLIVIFKSRWKIIIGVPYSLFVLISTYFTLLGLNNSGILARYLYQSSVTFRADYMHAGWAMTMKFPIFGVGMDSYGDWYRQLRGDISTNRTNPERTANTAHNIFLDISSNGGFTLLAIHVGLLSLALYSAISYFRKIPNVDIFYLAVFSAWCAYQVQALISINQIGVGVWGWIFTGVLIGYPRVVTSTPLGSDKSGKRERKVKALLPASAALHAIFGGAIGLGLAFVPFNADLRYYSALQTKALDQIVKSTKSVGATMFHRELSLQAAMQIPAEPQAYEIARELVREYPRSFFGWRVLASISVTPELEKIEALQRMKELDPYNKAIPTGP